MIKLVLRTNQQCGVPPLDVLRMNKDGSGESIAWFWRENEAREYINMHSEIESLRKENLAFKHAARRPDFYAGLDVKGITPPAAR